MVWEELCVRIHSWEARRQYSPTPPQRPGITWSSGNMVGSREGLLAWGYLGIYLPCCARKASE